MTPIRANIVGPSCSATSISPCIAACPPEPVWLAVAFMKGIKFESLFPEENEEDKPFIFHNAWNLDKRELALFSNRRTGDKAYQGPINASTLCACSALPFIEETVKMGGDTYCEGALVDTVNFQTLIENHGHEIDEIWVSRIVDSKQIRKPENLHDALANLCQLFAATVGEDDVKLFKYHLKEENNWKGTVVEIHVPAHVNFAELSCALSRPLRRERLAERAREVDLISIIQTDHMPLCRSCLHRGEEHD
jgi:predicted acylesterase/phospholipase RssA